MQNVQNGFSVENLIAKYRNSVKEHCPKLCCFDGVTEFLSPMEIDGNADEQLLITIYKMVAGDNADERIVEALSEYAEKFHKEALTKEEMSFLCEHFSEVVSYEFAHRKDWFMQNSTERIPEGRIRLLKEYLKPAKGAKIFIADTEYCDLAVQFPECIIYGFTGFDSKAKWALGQIRLFAAGIKSEIVSGEGLFEEYSYSLPEKGSMDAVVFRVNENKYFAQKIFGTECNDIESLYELLKPNGKMFFFSELMEEMAGNNLDGTWGKDIIDFRTRLSKEKTIKSIVSFEEESIWGTGRTEKNIMLEISKCENTDVCIKDEVSSRTMYIDASELDPGLLWPSYYFSARPQDGIPLSTLVTIARTRIKDEKDLAVFAKGEGWSLCEKAKNMPLVTPSLLGDSYKDANFDCNELRSKVGEMEAPKILWGITKSSCVFLYGSAKDIRVGYITDVPDNGIAYTKCCCLIPKDSVDVRYLAALLFEPSVKEQILTICDGDISKSTFSVVLDKIIVPNRDDKERLSFLSDTNYEALLSSQMEMRREHDSYSKAVRMRKHALTQSLSSVEAMFYALNEYRIRQNGNLSDDSVISRVQGTTVKEAFEFLSVEISNVMPALEHIADVEYSFSKPESIDPEEFIENYIEKEKKSWLNFKHVLSWEKGGNKAKQDIKNINGIVVCEKGKPLNTLVFPKDALEKIFDNILSNAKAYAFTDETRTDYQLRFSWHIDGASLIVEIDNNGTPIPEDRDTASLLEYGVSTALHKDGHNGIGCSEIKDIMSRYDGKVEIISSPKDDFTVKYVLTFLNANTNLFRLHTI